MTGPLYSTGTAQLQTVASPTFSVTAGHSYQVQLNAQSRVIVAYTDCDGQTGWLGGSIAVLGDGDEFRNLVGYVTSYPGGPTVTNQALVFGAGDHTVAIVNASNACVTVEDPGSVSMADSFLTCERSGAAGWRPLDPCCPRHQGRT